MSKVPEVSLTLTVSESQALVVLIDYLADLTRKEGELESYINTKLHDLRAKITKAQIEALS